MFLSRLSPSRLPMLSGLVIAAAAWLLAPENAAAQSPGSGPLPGSTKLWPWNVQGANQPVIAESVRVQPAAVASSRASVSRRVAPAPLVVAITTPAEPAPVYVDIRGPDGELRRFPLAGGRDVIQPRQVFVRAGESVTIQFVATTPTK